MYFTSIVYLRLSQKNNGTKNFSPPALTLYSLTVSIYHFYHSDASIDDGMTHGCSVNADFTANSAVSALSRVTMTRAGLGKSVWAPPNPSL